MGRIQNRDFDIEAGQLGLILSLPLSKLGPWSTRPLSRFRDSSAKNHFGPGLLGPNRYFYWDSWARDSSAQYKNTLFVAYNGKQMYI